MRTKRVWSSEEDALLKELYSQVSIEELCEKLGRSRAAIYCRAFRLSLLTGTKSPNELATRLWSQEDDELLMQLYRNAPLSQIAEEMNRTYGAVAHRIHILKKRARKIPQAVTLQGFVPITKPSPMTAELARLEGLQVLTKPPAINHLYFLADPISETLYKEQVWEGQATDYLWLERGLVFNTAEAAIAHANSRIKGN